MNPNASASNGHGEAWNDFYHVLDDDGVEYSSDFSVQGSVSAPSKKKAKKKAKKPAPGPVATPKTVEQIPDAAAVAPPPPPLNTNQQHILYLPLRPLLLILSYLPLTDLAACAFTCREMFERITSESVWKDTFFHYFERNYPTCLINLGLTWRSEFIERTNLMRNIASSSISTLAFQHSTSAGPWSRAIAFAEHALAVGNNDSVILLDSITGSQSQTARFAPPTKDDGGNWLMDATDGVGWFPRFAVAFCSPSAGLLNFHLHAHPYLGNAAIEPIHRSVKVHLSPPNDAAQPAAVAWLTANPIAHQIFPEPLRQTYRSPSCAMVAVAYSDTSLCLVCASMNGKCVQLALPRLSPPNSSAAVQRVCASTSTIIALLADKHDPAQQSLVAVPVPDSLFAHLSDHECNKPMAKKWEHKLANPNDPRGGGIATKRSPPPAPTASDWDTSRAFIIPPHFGAVVQVVYSAHTHPLAILRTSNRKSSPLVLVRIDHPTAPVLVAAIDLTSATLMTSLPAGIKPGSMTAFSYASGLDEYRLHQIPVYKHFPIYDPYAFARVTRMSVFTTMVLAVGDSKGNVHVFRVPPPRSSPSGGLPCPVDFEVEHFASLVGGGEAAIRAVHVNAGVVVAADVRGGVKVWDPLSGKCLRRFTFVRDEEGEPEQVTHITSWPEAPERIALVLQSGKIKVLDVRDSRDKIPKFCKPMERDLGTETGSSCHGG